MTMRSSNFVLTIAIAMCMWATASADDIDVFQVASGVKPNILFVFDRSGSMDFDLAGEVTSIKEDRRGDILREAFKQLLEENKDTIRAGLGPFYHDESSGVLWPITDLEVDASTIDASIDPADEQTAQSILEAIIARETNSGATNIVDALYESALYFRGDEVLAGGTDQAHDFRPYTWNSVDNIYENGEPRAPHPGTYLPSDAYHGTPNPEEDLDVCKDFTLGGLLPGKNKCDNASITRVENCQYVSAVAPDPDGEKCIEKVKRCNGGYGIDGECIDPENVCLAFGPDEGIPEHNLCDAYRSRDEIGSWAGADYVSPIKHSCQTNAIVLLSDGAPSKTHNQHLVRNLTGVSNCEDLSLSLFADSDPSVATQGNCAIELADFLATHDQVESVPDSSVRTYTIGFANDGPGQSFLSDIAKAGNGEFFPAKNAAELNDAFASVLTAISGEAETFAPISLDVDNSSASTGNKIFLSLFQPSSRRSWVGNLKGYFLGPNGLEDVNGVEATEISVSNIKIRDTAQSFWSTSPDGAAVNAGGANSRLNPSSRQLYTNTIRPDGAGGVDIATPGNYMTSGNTDITGDMLGDSGRDVLDWIHEQPMADPLHTQPTLVRYESREVVYTMTNQGLLHAIDVSSPTAPGSTEGGNELWAFMPQGLLKNLGKLSEIRSGEHIYGLDGGMTRYLDESVKSDGVITDGERAILYLGMRRGGRDYYAIDVSDPLRPKLLWEINGGEGDFTDLGQSWSRMALSTMKVYGTETKVLIFGGGYDPVLDDSIAPNSSNTMGNAVYIVEAETGDLIWQEKLERKGKRYAVPADVSVVDSDSDGLADRLYIADLGGRIWRVDFIDGNIDTSSYRLFNLADFSDSGDYHPFFYPPSVALVRDGLKTHIALTIGSGSRENPLYPDSANSIFMIKDRNVADGFPTDIAYWPIDTSSLYDTTSNDVASGNAAIASAAKQLNALMEGWYINLDAGEKVLATTSIFENQLLFTSFSPNASAAPSDDICAPAGVTGRFYRVDVADGRPLGFLSHDDPTGDASAKKERSKVVKTHGIPGSVALIFPKGSDEVKIYVDQQEVASVDQSLKRLMWFGN